MNSRPIRQNQLQRIPARNTGHKPQKYRRPFWLPASGYYALTAAGVIAFFFLAWGFLHEGGDEMPWIPAGIGASFVLGGAVVLREVILRKARNRFILIQNRLDYNLKNVPLHTSMNRNTNKLSLQKNADIINKIQQKSEAAKVLEKLSDGHWEVFEICNEYLRVNEKELENVGIGSPRIAALRRGKEIVQDLHRYHLLTWAQIESRSLTEKAKNSAVVLDKLETAQNALSVLDSALKYYPNDLQLTESEEAIKEFVASIKISYWIEQAERSSFKGNYKRAINHYKDALYFLARENVQSIEKDSIADKINREIESLRDLAEEKKQAVILKRVKRQKIND